MTRISVGIDLGTTNSSIGFFKDGQAVLIEDARSAAAKPALVASVVAEDQNGLLQVGSRALNSVDDVSRGTPHGIREAKRYMGLGRGDCPAGMFDLPSHKLSPVAVSAHVLAELKRLAEMQLGESITDAVVSVPANFTDVQKTATRDAAIAAGFEVKQLIAEPTAAVLAYGVENPNQEERVLVFDFGGGTLDISLVEKLEGVIDAKSVEGDSQLGGKDFDLALENLVKRRFREENPGAQLLESSLRELKSTAEHCKVQLSSDHTVRLYRPNFGQSDGAAVNLDIQVTRSEFEREVGPLLSRARECLRSAMRVQDVKPSTVDTVLLVGGTTYIPAVRRLVAETFGCEPRSDVDPDLAVCTGAVIQAALLDGELSPEDGLLLCDLSRYGFGVESAGVVAGQVVPGVYSPLMPTQSHFPFSAKHRFDLMHSEQESVRVAVYQVESDDVTWTRDAIETGVEGTIADIPPSDSEAGHEIEVEISVDSNNLIRVVASIPATGQTLPLVLDSYAARLSEVERQSLRTEVAAAQAASSVSDAPPPSLQTVDFASSEVGRECKPLVDRALQVLTGVGPEYRDRLKSLLESLSDALTKQNEQRAALHRDKLTDLLFDIEEAS